MPDALLADEIWQEVASSPGLALTILGLAGLLLAWSGGIWRNRRRSRTLRVALADSSRGALHIQATDLSGGFLGAIEPAPEPFSRLTIQARFASPLNPVRCIQSLVGIASGRVELTAALPTRPQAELVWKRDRVPGRALTITGEITLWQRRKLDITRSEYAVRGRGTGAIEHSFVELQTRFSPQLSAVSMLAEDPVHLHLAIDLAALNDDQIPNLIALVRATGRAASH